MAKLSNMSPVRSVTDGDPDPTDVVDITFFTRGEDDEDPTETTMEEDLNEALELLDSFQGHVRTILSTKKKKASPVQQQELRELVVETQVFLDQWNWNQ